jgi:hypothetical protein
VNLSIVLKTNVLFFLQKFVIWLQRWNHMQLKNIDKRHGKLTKQTQHALLHTTETLMLLCKFLFENDHDSWHNL